MTTPEPSPPSQRCDPAHPQGAGASWAWGTGWPGHPHTSFPPASTVLLPAGAPLGVRSTALSPASPASSVWGVVGSMSDCCCSTSPPPLEGPETASTSTRHYSLSDDVFKQTFTGKKILSLQLMQEICSSPCAFSLCSHHQHGLRLPEVPWVLQDARAPRQPGGWAAEGGEQQEPARLAKSLQLCTIDPEILSWWKRHDRV